MKFERERLQNLLWGKCDDLKKIRNEITGTSRWSVHYELVFEDILTSKFYSVSYSRGATEYQDERPFEYDGDEINCIEVKPVEKTIIVYEPVESCSCL